MVWIYFHDTYQLQNWEVVRSDFNTFSKFEILRLNEICQRRDLLSIKFSSTNLFCETIIQRFFFLLSWASPDRRERMIGNSFLWVSSFLQNGIHRHKNIFLNWFQNSRFEFSSIKFTRKSFSISVTNIGTFSVTKIGVTRVWIISVSSPKLHFDQCIFSVTSISIFHNTSISNNSETHFVKTL